jgi:hypothetical protein
MRLHVEEFLAEVDKVCISQRRQPVEQMAEALAVAFLAVKMCDPEEEPLWRARRLRPVQ